MSPTIRIVARPNAVGIGRDVRVLEQGLEPGRGRVAFSPYRSISPLRRFVGAPDTSESVVFLGRVRPRWLRSAGRYLLIPNQERFPQRLVRLLSRVDHVLCKSNHGVEVFGAVHPSVHYLGFTSVDRRRPDVEPDYGRFFHLGGGSSLKGTEDLLALWRRHPEWPTLNLLWHRDDTDVGPLPANVEWIRDYLPDARLRELQNRCGIHLCPSRSEGWGHYIVEAMSCGAVTVTTDGPPMNELVRPDRGVLVPVARTAPRKLGTDHFVDPPGLEAAVQRLVDASEAEKAAMGAKARAWYDENHAGFVARLNQLWAALVP